MVAISLFVGWNIVGQWAEKNETDYRARELLNIAETNYGPFNPSAHSYLEQSPDIENIMASVLPLQGTSDDAVPWQTVAAFYHDMKQRGKTFVLYPGGDHGLSDRFQKEANEAMDSWLREYGL